MENFKISFKSETKVVTLSEILRPRNAVAETATQHVAVAVAVAVAVSVAVYKKPHSGVWKMY